MRALTCFLGMLIGTALLTFKAEAQSTWTHNGSLVSLSADGSARQFIYQDPRPAMREVGVAAGTVLFRGNRRGNNYTGTAYVFSSRCGALPYAVTGFVSSDDRQVVLHGTAPQVDTNCRVVAGRDDVLTFDLAAQTPPVMAQGRDIEAEIATAREQGKQETVAYYQDLMNTKTRQMNAALAFEQQARRNAEEQARQAVNQARLAEQRAREAEARMPTATAMYAGPIEDTQSKFIDKCGALAPSVLVMFISLVIELFKRLTSKHVSFRRELVVETVANFISTGALVLLGYSTEWKVISVPFLGGLISLAFMLSIKHIGSYHYAGESASA
jgi:hypothetical protein